MHSTKTLLAAASLAVISAAGIGGASAAPWDRHPTPLTSHDVPSHDVTRHDMRDMRRDDHRMMIDRERILVTLRQHHYRLLGEPTFVRGHTVVKVSGRFGRPVLIEVDPRTGAILGAFRT